jgi:raffinose/stachyose/melibiose transport system substrate-binding protein
MFGGSDANKQNYDNAIAAYEQATGNTVQNESATADDVWTGSVLADFEVGSDPDVVQFWTLTPGNPLVEGKKVVSIDEIRAVYPEYASNISDGALAGSASPVDGKTYAIPTNGYWEGTFYNKALLAQVGYDSFPENWTDFIALCDALKAAGITPIAESLQGEPNYTFEFLMANQVGSALPSSTPKELGDEASKHITKVLEHFKNFYDSGYYPANTTTLNRAEAVQLVADGKAAMMFGGHWNRGGLDTATAEDGTVTTQAATDNIELFGFPTEDPAIRSANTFVGGYSSGFMITRKAWDDPAKRKACVDFVMSVTSDENITNYSGASASPLKVPGKLPEADSTPLLERCRAVIAGGENIFPALEDTWTAPAREGFLYSDIALYCAGTLTADQVIQNLITANAAS